VSSSGDLRANKPLGIHMKQLAAFLFLLVATSLARAEFVDGYKLKGFLDADERNEKSVNASIGVGYVTGVYDSLAVFYYCAPPNITIGQVVAIAHKYLKENPDKWNLPANILVAESLKNAWPCPKNK